MGHRTYLSIQTKNEGNELLFEANNSLPFFWIGLLDDKILDSIKPIWIKIEELLETKDNEYIEKYFQKNPTIESIKIKKESFVKNVNRTSLFLENYAPEALQLHKDFEQYIYSKFTKHNQYLVLDIIEIANFTSINEFITSLYNTIKAIDTQNLNGDTYLMKGDLIAGGTGFSSEFENFSQNYIKAKKDRQHNTPNFPIKKVTTKKSYIPHIIILITAPIFTYSIYRGYIKEGFSGMVIMLGISNLIFYTYSIFRLVEITAKLKQQE